MDRLRIIVAVILIVPLVLIGAYIFLSSIPSTPGANSSIHFANFEVNGKSFALTYLATNQSAQEKGLMNTKVTNDTTMLFVFAKPGYYSFWMFQVNSSLDIIWMNVTNGIGRVVYLVKSVPGCSVSVFCSTYQPTAEANMVLEAKGGFAAANSIDVGTTLSFIS